MKRTKAYLLAIETTENGASDDVYLVISSQDAELIAAWQKAVVLTKTVAVTSNISDVLAPSFVPTPLCLTNYNSECPGASP